MRRARPRFLMRDVPSVPGRPSLSLAAALMAVLLCACKDEDKGDSTGQGKAPVASPSESAGVMATATVATPEVSPSATAPSAASDGVDHSTHDCTLHSEPRPPPPPGASATALKRADFDKLTTIRVSAHVGSVMIRKQGDDWVLSGKRGCTVPAKLVRRALDNLASLSAKPSDHSLLAGSPFVLQIDVLMNEISEIHFQIAEAAGDGDVVRLMDGSVHVLYGLDHDLWVPKPTAWCQAL